jgi:segregation and condensation protein B
MKGFFKSSNRRILCMLSKEDCYDEIYARIEAALYSSGRPLTIDEIKGIIGTTSDARALKIVRELARKINSTCKALEIVELQGNRFVLQVKPEYYHIVKRFAPRPLLSKSALRTLSYIAYLQPINAKRLAEIRGSQVYEHIKELIDLKFIDYKVEGRTKLYYTTDKFYEYFGISDNKDLAKRAKELLIPQQ